MMNRLTTRLAFALALTQLVCGVAFADGSLAITVDPRIELLAAVQLLAGYDKTHRLLTQYDFPYKRDVAAHFAPFAGHEAVARFRKLASRGFTHDAPPTVMLYLTDPPALHGAAPLPQYLVRRAGGRENLVAFIAALRDFARESDFMAFFEAHEDEYADVIAWARETIGDDDYVAQLEDYNGMTQHGYHVILCQLYRGWYGPRVPRADGRFDLYAIVSLREGFLEAGTRERFETLILHEFSHSFVNAATARFAPLLMQYESLYTPIAAKMKQQAYKHWLTCVNEHLVRPATSRLAARRAGEPVGVSALAKERLRGFAYVEPLYAALAQYEKERSRYPTLVHFYPELIEVFITLAQGDDAPGARPRE